MLRALDEFEIGGLPTLLGFHRALLSHPEFIAGGTGHGLVESDELAARAEELTREPATDVGASDGRLRPRVTAVEVGGRRYDVTLLEPEPPWVELARRRRARETSGRGGAGSDSVVSPMQGTVLKVEVADGAAVEAGAVICVVEAMKMENEIAAHRAGTIADVSVAPGDAVANGQVICRVVADEA
jgi:acetyl-CoA/propionyl-CoA carboxylase, biotin carboxylase, biotin carboxyl carrier protein